MALLKSLAAIDGTQWESEESVAPKGTPGLKFMTQKKTCLTTERKVTSDYKTLMGDWAKEVEVLRGLFSAQPRRI